jgi:hypothetical protein
VAARSVLAEALDAVSWAWAGALCVAGLGAGLSVALANALRRETDQLRVARVEVKDLKSQLRRTGSAGSSSEI